MGDQPSSSNQQAPGNTADQAGNKSDTNSEQVASGGKSEATKKRSIFSFRKKQDESKHENKKTTEKKKKKKKTGRRTISIWAKDIVLAVVNLCFIAGLIFLLARLPEKANQVKSLRTASYVSTADAGVDILQFDLDANKDLANRLEEAFPSEDRLLEFVNEIETLKTEGVVVNFSFASKNPVMDRTKNFGYPIIIEMIGSWEQIATDVEKIQKLPFVFRPVTFDAEENPEENVVQLKYGGFLYVDQSLEKN